jgi:hypothetical protein
MRRADRRRRSRGLDVRAAPASRGPRRHGHRCGELSARQGLRRLDHAAGRHSARPRYAGVREGEYFSTHYRISCRAHRRFQRDQDRVRQSRQLRHPPLRVRSLSAAACGRAPRARHADREHPQGSRTVDRQRRDSHGDAGRRRRLRVPGGKDACRQNARPFARHCAGGRSAHRGGRLRTARDRTRGPGTVLLP